MKNITLFAVIGFGILILTNLYSVYLYSVYEFIELYFEYPYLGFIPVILKVLDTIGTIFIWIFFLTLYRKQK